MRTSCTGAELLQDAQRAVNCPANATLTILAILPEDMAEQKGLAHFIDA